MIVIAQLIIAVFFPSVTVVLAYAGSLPGSVLVYILPGVMMLRLNRKLSFSYFDKTMPLLLLIVGVMLSATGTYVQYSQSAELELGTNIDWIRWEGSSIKKVTALDSEGCGMGTRGLCRCESVAGAGDGAECCRGTAGDELGGSFKFQFQSKKLPPAARGRREDDSDSAKQGAGRRGRPVR